MADKRDYYEVLGVLLAVGLFMLLPNVVATAICDNVGTIAHSDLYSLWYSLIEGVIMLCIFISYILLVSLMKDVRRVFMYHGAEHKVITCYEHGLELTVENAKKMKREHSRCGTTFLFIVVAVSIMVFVLINFMIEKCGLSVTIGGAGEKIVNGLIKIGFKLLFLPVVAGVSYELLKLLAKSDNLFVRILRAPGMLLQKLTTKEPTDDMLEVSITAFKTVQEMDANPNLEERKFDISVPYGVARNKIESIAKGADKADIDWLFVEVTGKKRSELAGLKTLSKAEYDSAESIAKKMADGTPLQYALGYAYFYGIKIAVNQNVLIPRPETEELVQKAIGVIEDKNSRLQEGEKCDVLDLCTGSGAIAVAIAKNTKANVCACDVSVGAIDVALANSLNTGVRVDFSKGDMWSAVANKKFDVIVSNPPYIPTDDVSKLDSKVKDFEPKIALDGDKDGLKFYRIIAKQLDEHLKEDGVLLMEFGIGQAEEIKNIFGEYDVEIQKDVEGIERIAIVRRK